MILTVPVYRCQGSGMVRVEIVVAPDGRVTDAEVLEPIEGTDRICFADAALAAARSSRFRIEIKRTRKAQGHNHLYIYCPVVNNPDC